jgi:hypothetical protein
MRNIDWWPSSRLAITAAVLGLGAHFFLGWQPPIRYVLALPCQIFEVTGLLAMVSFALADLYLLLFLVPLLVLAVLNDWFFLGSRFAAEFIVGRRSALVLNLLGLGGEILLFGALGLALRRLFLPIW